MFILAMLCTHSVKCLCAQTDCSQPVCVVDQKEGNISVSSTCVFLPPIVSTWQVLPGLKGKKAFPNFWQHCESSLLVIQSNPITIRWREKNTLEAVSTFVEMCLVSQTVLDFIVNVCSSLPTWLRTVTVLWRT